ncbi:MAG: hypothetical protein LCH73_15550 [Proteobacteria bacterium]|nr:hypothetical protein [Pseudomonadota bacterium]
MASVSEAAAAARLVAPMVGFIRLAGIATRHGILKISRCNNLCRLEREAFSRAMIVRGSLERLLRDARAADTEPQALHAF